MGERVNVTMVCADCGARNYKTTRKPAMCFVPPGRGSSLPSGADDAPKGPLELKKHCPKCNRHTVHKESK